MTETITLSEQTTQSLETTRRELPDADSVEDAIHRLCWEFARDNNHLRVDLSGDIEHVEQSQSVEGDE